MIFGWQFNRQNTPRKTLDTVLRMNFKHHIFELFFNFSLAHKPLKTSLTKQLIYFLLPLLEALLV